MGPERQKGREEKKEVSLLNSALTEKMNASHIGGHEVKSTRKEKSMNRPLSERCGRAAQEWSDCHTFPCVVPPTGIYHITTAISLGFWRRRNSKRIMIGAANCYSAALGSLRKAISLLNYSDRLSRLISIRLPATKIETFPEKKGKKVLPHNYYNNYINRQTWWGTCQRASIGQMVRPDWL